MTATRTTPEAARTDGSEPAAGTATARRRWAVPVHPWLLLPLAVGGYMLVAMSGAMHDVDVYWHVLLGQEIVERPRVSDLGAWSFAVVDEGWTTTQWLSEVLFHLVHQLAGYTGLTVLRTALGLVVMLAVAGLLLRGPGSIRVRAAVTAAVLFPLGGLVQERPQTISLLLLVWLARLTTRALQGRQPSVVGVLVVTWVWANLHGLWVMVPVALGLVALCRALDHRRARVLAGEVRLPLAAAAVGALTPAGPRLYSSSLEVAAAARGHITEWEAVDVTNPFAWSLLVLVGLTAAAWARADRPVPRAEVLFVLALTGYALVAYRNVVVSLLLMAPLIAGRLATSLDARPSHVGPREARVLGSLLAVALAATATGALVRAAVVDPVPDLIPRQLLSRLDERPGTVRVLNDYNLGGAVVALAGPDVRVAVDGRADYYGAEFLESYNDLLATRPGWRLLLQELDPDVALLESDEPLVEALLDAGWTRVAEEGDHTLLDAP